MLGGVTGSSKNHKLPQTQRKEKVKMSYKNSGWHLPGHTHTSGGTGGVPRWVLGALRGVWAFAWGPLGDLREDGGVPRWAMGVPAKSLGVHEGAWGAPKGVSGYP